MSVADIANINRYLNPLPHVIRAINVSLLAAL
jgi:hypothetical protein